MEEEGVKLKTVRRVKLLPGDVKEIPLIQEGTALIKKGGYVFEPDGTTMNYFGIDAYVQSIKVKNERGIMIAVNEGARTVEIPSGITMGHVYRIEKAIPVREED